MDWVGVEERWGSENRGGRGLQVVKMNELIKF